MKPKIIRVINKETNEEVKDFFWYGIIRTLEDTIDEPFIYISLESYHKKDIKFAKNLIIEEDSVSNSNKILCGSSVGSNYINLKINIKNFEIIIE